MCKFNIIEIFLHYRMKIFPKSSRSVAIFGMRTAYNIKIAYEEIWPSASPPQSWKKVMTPCKWSAGSALKRGESWSFLISNFLQKCAEWKYVYGYKNPENSGWEGGDECSSHLTQESSPWPRLFSKVTVLTTPTKLSHFL